MGWPRDYAMVRAFDRLRAPPLREADYEGLVEPARMAETNASLAAHPFGGVIVACPWLPDVRPAATGDISAYARYLLDVLLPRVRQETPALSSPEATGIDGVSLGGMLALRIGLTVRRRVRRSRRHPGGVRQRAERRVDRRSRRPRVPETRA